MSRIRRTKLRILFQLISTRDRLSPTKVSMQCSTSVFFPIDCRFVNFGQLSRMRRIDLWIEENSTTMIKEDIDWGTLKSLVPRWKLRKESDDDDEGNRLVLTIVNVLFANRSDESESFATSLVNENRRNTIVQFCTKWCKKEKTKIEAKRDLITGCLPLIVVKNSLDSLVEDTYD